MARWQRWIKAGIPVAGENTPGTEDASKSLQLFAAGQVRLTTSDSGTEIKWAVDSPCFASLYRAMECLVGQNPPFVLRFHAMGWFEEVFASADETLRRVQAIMARGDRYFTSRAFVMAGNIEDKSMPFVLRESLERQAAPDEYCVDCAFDESSHNYVVDRIGPKSAIGRLWGTYTSSFPCQSRSKYGDAVSAAYSKVLEEGRPHYDQVLAAMRLPDNQIHWVPYHRLIFPNSRRQGLAAVSIVSEIAKVEFSVI